VSIPIVFVSLILAFVRTVCNVSVGREFMFCWVVRFGVSGCVCGSGFPIYRVFLSPDNYHVKESYFLFFSSILCLNSVSLSNVFIWCTKNFQLLFVNGTLWWFVHISGAVCN